MARVNYKCTVPDDKWATKQHLTFACLPASSMSRLLKQGHFESNVCPCYTWTFTVFLQQNFINNRLCVCLLLWKRIKIIIVPKNFSWQTLFFWWNIIGLFLPQFLAGIKNLQRSGHAHFLVLCLYHSVRIPQTWALSWARSNLGFCFTSISRAESFVHINGCSF